MVAVIDQPVTASQPVHTVRAWTLLFVVSAFLALRGLGEIVLGGAVWSPILEQHMGASWEALTARDPGAATVVNFLAVLSGLFALGFGTACAIVAALGFRRGERSAWWALWTLPAFHVAAVVLVLVGPAGGNPFVLGVEAVPLILALVGLLLPYRTFFPRH